MSYAVKFKQDTRFFYSQELAEKFCKLAMIPVSSIIPVQL